MAAQVIIGNFRGELPATAFRDMVRAASSEKPKISCPHCGVDMVFRRGVRAAGSITERVDHFAAAAKKDGKGSHGNGCPELLKAKQGRLKQTIRDAIFSETPVIINLNMGEFVKGTTRTAFYEARGAAVNATGVNNYVPVAVSDATELAAVTAQMREIHADFKKINERLSSSKIFVAYKGVVRPLDDLRVNKAVHTILSFLNGVMGRTSKPEKNKSLIFSPYLPMTFVLPFAQKPGTLDMGAKIIRFPAKKRLSPDMFEEVWVTPPLVAGSPYSQICFSIETDNPDILAVLKAAKQDARDIRIIAAVNETELRHAIHARGRDRGRQESDIIEIPLIIMSAHQVVGAIPPKAKRKKPKAPTLQ